MASRQDLAVISCHFNPCGYLARQRNLRAFLASTRAHGVPLFVAELAFGSEPFTLPAGIQGLRLRGRDVMWHKERLLNIAARALPAQYTKVAWLDADVIYPDGTWYAIASGMLEEFPLIQLFETVSTGGAEPAGAGTAVRGLAACAAQGTGDPFLFGSGAWPGLAWAASRELLAAHQLFDTMIVGGGDTYLGLAAIGPFDDRAIRHRQVLPPKLRDRWSAWSARLHGDVRGRLGYVPVQVTQLEHGSPAGRGYLRRLRMLAEHDFDPAADLTSGRHGVWQWGSGKQELHRAVRQYFADRREDDAPLR